MKKVPASKVATTTESADSPLPPKVQEALGEMVGAAREGLLALSVGVGLSVVHELMESEVTEVVGPKGKHHPERSAKRHGHEDGSMTLGGRRVRVSRPRMRTADDERELPLGTYEHFADRDPLTRAVMDRMLASARRRSATCHRLAPAGWPEVVRCRAPFAVGTGATEQPVLAEAVAAVAQGPGGHPGRDRGELRLGQHPVVGEQVEDAQVQLAERGLAPLAVRPAVAGGAAAHQRAPPLVICARLRPARPVGAGKAQKPLWSQRGGDSGGAEERGARATRRERVATARSDARRSIGEHR